MPPLTDEPEEPVVPPLTEEPDDEPVEPVDPLAPGVVPAGVPGEPALPLIRPLLFGMRLASVLLPGEVIVEPPLVAAPPAPTPEPGEALGAEVEPELELELGLALEVDEDDEDAVVLVFACWLQASKSAWV